MRQLKLDIDTSDKPTQCDIDYILSQPFDIKTHKKTFTEYCEVIIWPDGKIEYCAPSHNEKLINIYAQMHGLNCDDAVEELRKTYGINAIDEILKMTGIIEIWYDYIHNETRLTDAQHKSLSMLLEHGCISARSFDSLKVL